MYSKSTASLSSPDSQRCPLEGQWGLWWLDGLCASIPWTPQAWRYLVDPASSLYEQRRLTLTPLPACLQCIAG